MDVMAIAALVSAAQLPDAAACRAELVAITAVRGVGWYTLGGLTDIENLLPLCNEHHHLAHEGGWVLHLAPDRTLTVTRPGGATSEHGPPHAGAA